MKAILMLRNKPNRCSECPFHTIYADDTLESTYCLIMNESNDKGTTTILKDCPLIEINDNIARLIEVARWNIQDIYMS